MTFNEWLKEWKEYMPDIRRLFMASISETFPSLDLRVGVDTDSEVPMFLNLDTESVWQGWLLCSYSKSKLSASGLRINRELAGMILGAFEAGSRTPSDLENYLINCGQPPRVIEVLMKSELFPARYLPMTVDERLKVLLCCIS